MPTSCRWIIFVKGNLFSIFNCLVHSQSNNNSHWLFQWFQFQPQPKYKIPNRAENGNGSSKVLQIPNKINYGTGLGHIALCGVSGWAIHQMQFDQSPLSLCCFTFMIGHSLLGAMRYTHPSVSECVVKTYHITTLLAQTLPLLLVTTQMFINLRLLSNYIYIQVLFALLPTICDFSNQPRYRDHTINVIVVGNALVLVYAGICREKFWSTGLAVLSVLNHFSLKPICSRYDVPRTDLFIVGLGFFIVFAVNCLNEWNCGKRRIAQYFDITINDSRRSVWNEIGYFVGLNYIYPGYSDSLTRGERLVYRPRCGTNVAFDKQTFVFGAIHNWRPMISTDLMKIEI